MLIRQAVALLNTASETVESLRLKMNGARFHTAGISGCHGHERCLGSAAWSLQPWLRLGRYTLYPPRFPTAFAGVDPERMIQDSMFRKACEPQKKVPFTYAKRSFQVMDSLIKRSPADDPVYAFMDKKRAQRQTLLRLHDCRGRTSFSVFITDG